MNASDIMTSPVITVGPDTQVRHIAGLLFKHRISAVPVLDNGRLVGIVSEADLIHRHEIGTESGARTGAWWLQLFGPDHTVADYVKSHATRARDLMTPDVVTVGPDTPVAKVARLFEKHRVKRVPVLKGTQLVGIVSRSNLVQALAAKGRVISPDSNGDSAIRAQVCAELERQPWWRALTSNVVVTDGIVHYFGTFDSEDQKQAARIAAENVPGVRAVQDHRVPIAAISWSV
jgi:CBS-domain-containing membrane protein